MPFITPTDWPDDPPITSLFDGDADGEHATKDTRLKKQLERVFEVMAGGRWLTLSTISWRAGATEASASARIRDLRKPRFGGFDIVMRPTDLDGINEYRLIPDSGEARYVYTPLRDPRSTKPEARKRISAALDARDQMYVTHPGNYDLIGTYGGHQLRSSDIRELLR